MLILWMCILITAVLVVLCILLFLQVNVRIDVTHRDHDTDGVIHLRYLFGLVHIKRHLFGVQTIMTDEGPAVKATHSALGITKSQGSEKSIMTLKEALQIALHWPAWLDLLRELWRPFEGFLRRVHMEQCDIEAWVGTGDVVLTGIAYGSLWALTSSVVGRLTFLCHFDHEPRVQIHPNFQNPALGTDVHCILRVRAGYAMWAAMRLIRVWKRRKTDGSSHSGAHENGHGKHS